ncbi:MAG: hypothetical protein AAF628_38230 [Planctomycetota bacterium]
MKFIRDLAIAIALTGIVMPAQTEAAEASAEKSWEDLATNASKPLARGMQETLRPMTGEDGAVPMAELVAALRRTGVGSGREGSRTVAADLEFVGALDPEQSGRVMPKNVMAAIRAAFTAGMESRTSLDTDGDGILTKKEYAVGQVPKFGEFDEHGLDGHGRGHFRREDSNQDGQISLAEETFLRVQSRVAGRVHRFRWCILVDRAMKGETEIGFERFASMVEADAEVAKELWNKLAGEASELALNELSPAVARLRAGQRDDLLRAVFGASQN